MFRNARNTFTRLALTLAVMLGLVAPSTVKAQDVASGSASATVLAVLTVTAVAPLAFGNVYQGVAKSVANNEAAAGIFTVTGAASSQVSLFMTLPEFVALASGADRMTIAFSSTDAKVDSTTNVDPTVALAGGWGSQNPRAFNSATRIGATQLSVFLGGKIIPSANQTAGAYSGDVVLTVAYTGV